ncbi:transmembrane protein 236-like [Myxocyprinus asiaticus]|uniref:transmembrane protein 236-like n=1 Tax=Myxocyprinus asiaticus TaxID=70543 RepID=UPI0022220E5C|nr:transmembrane protein 236-like [Myxocyprinus asiaticus]
MGSGSKIKFAVCEVLQFASFCVPLFIIMQRFALIVAQVRSQLQPAGGNSTTAYWLIVASSVAYVTSVAMLIWLPMKYMVFMKKKALVARKKWRPVALAYVLLSTLPCFAFLIASSELQIRHDLRLDTFAELPVSLVLFSLICIDIVERIRHCRLTGQANELARDSDIPTTMLTHVGRVTQMVTPMTGPSPTATNASAGTEHGVVAANGIVRGLPGNATVSGLPANGAVPGHSATTTVPGLPNNGAVPSHLGGTAVSGLPAHGAVAGLQGNTTVPGLNANGAIPRLPGNQGQPFGITGISPHSGVPFQNFTNFTNTPPHSGPLGFLLASDARAEVFADSFLFWLDTVEMVRVAGHMPVYFSGWALPVYLFCFLSTMRLVLTPHSPLLSPLGVALQDLPFLILRISLIAIFGFVTPLLYVMKNLLVCLAYIYFNFMTKLRVFNTERMF